MSISTSMSSVKKRVIGQLFINTVRCHGGSRTEVGSLPIIISILATDLNYWHLRREMNSITTSTKKKAFLAQMYSPITSWDTGA
jgi:hypothetical protein